MSKLTISWTNLAKKSYLEELDFIQLKWSSKEVETFVVIVNDYLENLSSGILQGKSYQYKNIHSIVISKQTTLFYRIHQNQNSVALLLFWNNQKNPNQLQKTLQKL
jgi:hypothetical protein